METSRGSEAPAFKPGRCSFARPTEGEGGPGVPVVGETGATEEISGEAVDQRRHMAPTAGEHAPRHVVLFHPEVSEIGGAARRWRRPDAVVQLVF